MKTCLVVLGVIYCLCQIPWTNAKIYERCELVNELKHVHGLPDRDAAMFACIGERQSNLDTNALGSDSGAQYHGLFQLSDAYWCSPPGKGYVCGVACADLRDDDLTDDIQCARDHIFDEHQRISGDGFNAWPSNHFCKSNVNEFMSCLSNKNYVAKKPAPTKKVQTKKPSASQSRIKIYDACELAQDLVNHHSISMDHVATWVCIAYHESRYNTSAIGRLNWDGSGDHGLFQISDLYWCGINGPGKACGVACSDLTDDDITDDVECIKRIHAEHTRLSGDGFTAWAVYPRCRGDVSSYIDGCFAGQNVINGHRPRPAVTSPPKPAVDYKSKQNIGTGKKYNNCELAKELHKKHSIPYYQLATWVCIAKHESNYDTSAVGRLNADGSEDHGLFQISDLYWCDRHRSGKACNAACADFRDNDISDDVNCIKKIHEEHTRLSGDGFNAWTVYQRNCKGDVSRYINGCFKDNEINEVLPPTKPPHFQQKPAITAPTRAYKAKPNVGTGKKYTSCELAQELFHKHKMPSEQIATWVCIAKHESSYDTAAVGRLNWDGSEDHGLFQVSDIYWCTHGAPGKACNIACEDLRDNDISDDIKCIKQIHAEHTRLSGDGFNAWTVYSRNCKGDVSHYIDGCFKNNEIGPISGKPKPGVTAPTRSPAVYQPRGGTGKKYNKCELAKELYHQHNLPFHQIATWVCIAQHESSFDTSAVGRLNADGSEDHGLFQISDIYWCSHGSPGKACNIACENLRNNDLADDIRCIKQIHEEHTRLSGDGFNAWTVYPRNCKSNVNRYIDGCFTENEINVIAPGKKPDSVPKPTKPYRPKNNSKGKVYTKCELAKELRDKHKLPLGQIGTWVCIAQHESSFNTSAIGRLNWDGSEDHGLFQISDIYWCSIGQPGKACNLPCSDLEDNDITDDVECIKQIYEEHTLLSGDGFNAWAVYPRNCKGRSSNFVDDCFKPSTTVTTKKPITTVTTTRTTTRVSTTTSKPVQVTQRQQNWANWGTTTTTTKKPVSTTTTTTRKPTSTTTTRRPVSTTTTTKKPVSTTTTTKKPVSTTTTTRKPVTASTTTKRPIGTSTTTKKPVSTTTRKPVSTTTTTRKPISTTTVTTRKPDSTTTTTRKPTTTPTIRTTTSKIRSSQATPQRLINLSLETLRNSQGDISKLLRVARSSVAPSFFTSTTPKPFYQQNWSTKPTTSWTTTTKKQTTTQKLTTTTRKPSTTTRRSTTWSSTTRTTKAPNFNSNVNTVRTTSRPQSNWYSTTKPSTTSTTRRLTTSKYNDIKSSTLNTYDWYIKHVLGGKPLTVAPYDFEYIRNLGKPTIKSASG